MTVPDRPWVVVTAYPSWPSPYIRELHNHIGHLRPRFLPDLNTVGSWTGPPGVLNLHRLKRLYRDQDGRRTTDRARRLLSHLAALRETGWKVVWTVHNLLPIDGQPPGSADLLAAHGVLGLADAVVTHTRADAEHLATLTDARITVAGWGGLSCPPSAPPLPERLAAAVELMRAHRSVLVLGNLTDYKGLSSTVRAFLKATTDTRMVIVGPERSPGLTERIRQTIEQDRDERVHLVAERIHPHHTAALYAVADAALCPYRTDGEWAFFTRVLHPSSVGTALGFGCPVIAPDLPAIAEMTQGHPRLLHPHDQDPGAVLATWETSPFPTTRRTTPGGDRQWRRIGAAYTELAHGLWADQQKNPSATDQCTESP